MPAQRQDHAIRVDRLDHIHHVFEGERLEEEHVGGIVVGRNGFGITVDHDGLVAISRQRVACLYAAVVEFDALPDAVGACAQDDDALALLRREFGFGRIVGLVVIRGGAREFGGTGVHRLECGQHA